MRNFFSRLLIIVSASLEGPSKYSYKVVDIEESLDELMQRDENLSGYSLRDVNIIMQALYEYKYGNRYRLQSINFKPNNDIEVVLEDVLKNKVISYQILELIDEYDILTRIGEADRKILHHIL